MENIWRFDNSYAKNVAHFGVNNSSPSYPNNRINNFSVLKVGEIFHINSSFGAPDTKFSISFTNTKTKFCFSLRYNVIVQ